VHDESDRGRSDFAAMTTFRFDCNAGIMNTNIKAISSRPKQLKTRKFVMDITTAQTGLCEPPALPRILENSRTLCAGQNAELLHINRLQHLWKPEFSTSVLADRRIDQL
jgi:hypothetical protein